MLPVKVLIFDWGDTLMRDFPDMFGPMVSWPRVEVLPGVPEALEALSGTYMCVVASNAGASNAELMGQSLERVGIRRHFRHLFTSKELGAAKPDPRFFRGIAERVGVEREACVMVGNDLAKDIAGARQVGMRTVWLKPGAPGGGATSGAARGAAAPAEPAADTVIASMAELPGAVARLGKSCPFCSPMPDGVEIYRDDLVYAVVSRRPINRYHVMVIPHRHYELFTDLPDTLAAHITVVAKRLSQAVREVCRPDAVSHLFDDDLAEKGFNLVPHFKLHIIPRYQNDKVKIEWNRDPDPGDDVRSTYAMQIRAALKPET